LTVILTPRMTDAIVGSTTETASLVTDLELSVEGEDRSPLKVKATIKVLSRTRRLKKRRWLNAERKL